MILRQPLPQRRRHQQQLITITPNEVLSHPRMSIDPPDGTVYATATEEPTVTKVRTWVGLDVHAATVVACVVDAESGEMIVQRFQGTRARW